jgi:hypothetical protein
MVHAFVVKFEIRILRIQSRINLRGHITFARRWSQRQPECPVSQYKLWPHRADQRLHIKMLNDNVNSAAFAMTRTATDLCDRSTRNPLLVCVRTPQTANRCYLTILEESHRRIFGNPHCQTSNHHFYLTNRVTSEPYWHPSQITQTKRALTMRYKFLMFPSSNHP